MRLPLDLAVAEKFIHSASFEKPSLPPIALWNGGGSLLGIAPETGLAHGTSKRKSFSRLQKAQLLGAARARKDQRHGREPLRDRNCS